MPYNPDEFSIFIDYTKGKLESPGNKEERNTRAMANHWTRLGSRGILIKVDGEETRHRFFYQDDTEESGLKSHKISGQQDLISILKGILSVDDDALTFLEHYMHQGGVMESGGASMPLFRIQDRAEATDATPFLDAQREHSIIKNSEDSLTFKTTSYIKSAAINWHGKEVHLSEATTDNALRLETSIDIKIGNSVDTDRLTNPQGTFFGYSGGPNLALQPNEASERSKGKTTSSKCNLKPSNTTAILLSLFHNEQQQTNRLIQPLYSATKDSTSVNIEVNEIAAAACIELSELECKRARCTLIIASCASVAITVIAIYRLKTSNSVLTHAYTASLPLEHITLLLAGGLAAAIWTIATAHILKTEHTKSKLNTLIREHLCEDTKTVPISTINTNSVDQLTKNQAMTNVNLETQPHNAISVEK